MAVVSGRGGLSAQLHVVVDEMLQQFQSVSSEATELRSKVLTLTQANTRVQSVFKPSPSESRTSPPSPNTPPHCAMQLQQQVDVSQPSRRALEEAGQTARERAQQLATASASVAEMKSALAASESQLGVMTNEVTFLRTQLIDAQTECEVWSLLLFAVLLHFVSLSAMV